jgi:hypothetical protein
MTASNPTSESSATGLRTTADARSVIHVPRLLHSINVAALLLWGVLLLLTAVGRNKAALVILIPIPILLFTYWRLRARPTVVAWYFAIPVALLTWIVLCENIVLVDQVVGTRISKQLLLEARLASYVEASLDTGFQRELEPCCNDPALTWHYRPGSSYVKLFDCPPTCHPPYRTTVDETGYLNEPLCPPQCYPRVDMFVAGDSLLEGHGVRSVVQHLRSLPLRLWNLSISGYGPRQKVNALLTYAVPHNPQWVVLEFFSGNDLTEAIQDDVISRHGGDFRWRYNTPTLARHAVQDPLYARIFDIPNDRWARLADYCTENLTLAMTRYALDTLKGFVLHPQSLREWLRPPDKPAPPRRLQDPPPRVAQVTIWNFLPLLGMDVVPIRKGQDAAFVRRGLALTQREYDRLAIALAGRAQRPEVILLYNPAPYEVYRLLGMELNPRAEEIFSAQRDALRSFALVHGWQFLDLTEPLRNVARTGVWVFGEYDQLHWSPQGTAIVADILRRELSKILRLNDQRQTRAPGRSRET